MLLGDREVHPVGPKGESEYLGMSLLTAGRNVYATCGRVGRNAVHLSFPAHSPHLRLLCIVAVQKNRAGSTQSTRDSLEARDASDPSAAVWRRRIEQRLSSAS